MLRNCLLAALLALGLATPARADTIDATVTTLLAGHEDPRDGKIYTVVPAYETVALTAELEAPYLDQLRLVMSGWGNLAFGDPVDGKLATGDLDIGFVEAKALKRITLRLGRQLAVGGAARNTQFDGATLEVRMWHGLALTAYGGAPVTPRFGTSHGDALAGGRLYYRHAMDTEVGVSAIQVVGVGRIARQDVAVDGRWAPHRTLSFTGYADWSLVELRLAEANVAGNWQPLRQLQISCDYRRVAPDLFLPLNSIFSVFSQETRDELGGSVFAHPLPALRLYGDYHAVNDASGWGHRGGGKLTLTVGRDGGTLLGAEGRVLRLPLAGYGAARQSALASGSDGYWQARLFGSQRLPGKLFVTLDGDTYFLEQPINGQSYSFTAAGTLGWDFAPAWRTVVTGIADITPFVDHRFEFLAKLIYNHTFHFHEARP